MLRALTLSAKHRNRLSSVGVPLTETNAVPYLFNRIAVRVELKFVDHVWMVGGGRGDACVGIYRHDENGCVRFAPIEDIEIAQINTPILACRGDIKMV